MSQKKLVSILLVLIVLVGIGYVVFTQSNRSVQNTQQITTGNWKTYSNGEYGFEIKVPSDWQVTVGKDNDSSSGSVAFNSKENVEFSYSLRNTDTEGNPSNVTFLYYADVKKAAGYDNPGTFAEYLKKSQDQSYFIKSQKISFVGQDAYRGVETGMYDTDAIWFEREGHFYKILLQNDRGMDSEVSTKILSTFKFVK